MKNTLRDAPLGQLLNWLSNGRILPYADQRKDYIIPDRYKLRKLADSTDRTGESRDDSMALSRSSPSSADEGTLVDEEEHNAKMRSKDLSPSQLEEGEKQDKGSKRSKEEATEEEYPYLVTFDGDDDPDRPMGWSRGKRLCIASLIMFYTFSVYLGSAVYTSSIPSLEKSFGISQVVGTLGLTLFILGYGIGPMFMSPLQEIPQIGRNPPYVIGLFFFVLFQMPILLAPNIATIMVFRFLSGFAGAPALATGGASMGDVFGPDVLPFAIAAWAIGAVLGPTMGPVIGNFSAAANGWRWPIFELLWMSGAALIVLIIALPETLESTILLRRAQRLRKLTGNDMLKAPCELEEKTKGPIGEVVDNWKKAFRLSVEPAIGFANLYIGLVYAIFYLWFESFPITFVEIHGFSEGVSGLPYCAFLVAGAITYGFYFSYLKYYFLPRMDRAPETPPEFRLQLALFGSVWVPISLLGFSWTSRASIHWIAPTCFAGLYLFGVFLIFQALLMYISDGYPQHVASIFAGNAFFRSTMAAGFPLFGSALFKNLGMGPAGSLLAGLAILMIPVIYLLYRYGDRLRARSKFAGSQASQK